MVHPDVLAKYGCTPERLRKIFTSPCAPLAPAQVSLDQVQPPKAPKTDGEIRRRFESLIRARVIDGIGLQLQTSRAFQAVDLAADAKPIQPHTIPLMLWACGKIGFEGLQSGFRQAGCSTETTDSFFKKNEAGKIIGMNETRLAEVSIDIVKSYIRRRLAAMNVLWSNLWPLFRYDPRGTDDISQLRGDVLSQRVDIMSDAYNYRHLRGQCNRQMLLYGYSIAFPRCAWDVKRSIRFKPSNLGPSTETESYVEREGIDFVTPHPSRMFWDQSSPLANINTDTGPRWIGYWDIVRYGDLLLPDSPYFNLDEVFVSDGWTELAAQNANFFAYYFNPTVLKWPDRNATIDPTLCNDRAMKVGRYTSEAQDQSVLLTNCYFLINPKQEGIGEYDSDVWVRLTVAGDYTVVAAEFMPSRPAAYGGIDCNDNRFANQSMGMALLSYQDQATNIVTQMLQQIRIGMMQLLMLDSDSLPADLVEKLKKDGTNKEWWLDPKVWVYSATKLKDAGFQDPRAAFFLVQNQITNAVQNGMNALSQLLALADRLIIFSPNELGQPNPREVSAREISEQTNSVQSMYSFINEGPREQVAAMKQMIFESLMCCGTERIRVPIEKRYSRQVIEAAGFTIPSDVSKGIPPDALLPVRAPLEGNLKDLNYDYYFDSRDGAERVVSADAANAMVNLMGFIMKVPGLPQKMGMNAIMDAANQIIRLTGAPWNFQFDVPRGADDSIPPEQQPPQPDQDLQQVIQAIQMMAGQIGKIQQVLGQVLNVPAQAFQGGATGAAPASPGGQAALPPGAPAPGGRPAPPVAAAPPPGAELQPPAAAA